MNIHTLTKRWEIEPAIEARAYIQQIIADLHVAKAKALRAKSAGKALEIATRFYCDRGLPLLRANWAADELVDSDRMRPRVIHLKAVLADFLQDSYYAPLSIAKNATDIRKTKIRVESWFIRFESGLNKILGEFQAMVAAA